MTEHDGERRVFCRRCDRRGRLLPSSKGQLACVECGAETIDTYGLTDGLTRADFDAQLSFAKQLRKLRARQEDCPHDTVMVSTRPYCAACGKPLGPGHPGHQMALAASQRGDWRTGPLGDVLQRLIDGAQR